MNTPGSTVPRTVTRRAVVGAAAVALAGGLAVTGAAGSAQAADPRAGERSSSRVTLAASASQVHSGEQFALRGRVTSAGSALHGVGVRVQAYRGTRWYNLRGAVVRTGSDGRYRVRVVLSSTGDRDLRVVARPGHGVSLSRAYTVVRVLG